MKSLFVSFALLASFSAFAAAPYPTSPDPTLTPGSLCDKPNNKRYSEGIPYCSRDVESNTKREIMRTYDERLGYRITSMGRGSFKIDHYIPLCAGGSNNVDNLWPQHVTVYTVTDPIEHTLCQKMAKNKLRQAEAIELIKRAKADLTQAPSILEQIERL